MTDKLSFATFDPLLHDTPALCGVCASAAPVFAYEFRTEEHGETKENPGFCCVQCAGVLLKKLEGVESREWAEEEKALQAEDMDIAEFKQRRLAAFGAGRG